MTTIGTTSARAVVSGRVLDALNRPVSGARVFVRQAPGPVPDLALLTDGDGRFTLSLPTSGRYELVCNSDELGATSITFDAGASDTTVRLQFSKAGQAD